MSVYPGVIVDWCITAKVKGKGKPQRHQEMGPAGQASDGIIYWLYELRSGGDLGESPRIEIEAKLTSEQLPGWVHTVRSDIAGMPAEEAVEYSVDWLEEVTGMDNWGGGGGP